METGVIFCVWQRKIERKNLLTGNGKQTLAALTGKGHTASHLGGGSECAWLCVQARVHMRAQGFKYCCGLMELPHSQYVNLQHAELPLYI